MTYQRLFDANTGYKRATAQDAHTRTAQEVEQ